MSQLFSIMSCFHFTRLQHNMSWTGKDFFTECTFYVRFTILHFADMHCIDIIDRRTTTSIWYLLIILKNKIVVTSARIVNKYRIKALNRNIKKAKTWFYRFVKPMNLFRNFVRHLYELFFFSLMKNLYKLL